MKWLTPRVGIKAGEGIEAGLSSTSEWISVWQRIFAGLCMWRLPDPGETEIRAEIRFGTIAFGTHVPPATATTDSNHGAADATR